MPQQDSLSDRQDFSHRRRNALTGEWVLISPHRLKRPWQGATSEPDNAAAERPAYDPNCYLCPGNARADGGRNPNYEGVYIFDNDFPALQQSEVAAPENEHPLFQWAPEAGICRVVCFSPDHSRTLSDLSDSEIAALVDAWSEQTVELGARYPNGSVQIFENKGELMGCSNPHPHGQIWAQQSIPTQLGRELEHCENYFRETGKPLMSDYAAAELASGARFVCDNDHFAIVVPYWATWPYETLVFPKRQAARLPQLSSAERASLGLILRELSVRYDNLFNVSFPYSAGLHQAPAVGSWDASFTLHMHFYPPLLRSAEVRKFMVGYEMMGEAQRDLTPETAADTLRGLPGR